MHDDIDSYLEVHSCWFDMHFMLHAARSDHLLSELACMRFKSHPAQDVLSK